MPRVNTLNPGDDALTAESETLVNGQRLSGLQVGLVVCASALVAVGLGFAGGVSESVTTASAAPDDSRDHSILKQGSGGSYFDKHSGSLSTQGSGALVMKRDGTLNTQGSGGLIVKRDGTLVTQGSGRLIYKRDNTLSTQGSGALYLKRDNEAGGNAEDSEVPLAVAEPVAALTRGAGQLAFDSSSDGFGFQNYAIGTGPDEKNVSGITTDSARAVLGDAAVCKPGTDPCAPTAKAKTWIDESNKLGKYGQCFGMAAALVGFQGDADAGFSSPAAAQTLESQPVLQRALATWQASQDTVEVERARQTLTANDAVTALTAAFKDPQAGQFMMTIANRGPKTGQRTQGHALAPYGFSVSKAMTTGTSRRMTPTLQDPRQQSTSILRPTPGRTRRVH